MHTAAIQPLANRIRGLLNRFNLTGWTWAGFFRATALDWVLLAYAYVSHLIAEAAGMPIPWRLLAGYSFEMTIATFGVPIAALLAVGVLVVGHGYSVRAAFTEVLGNARDLLRSPLRILDAARLLLGVKITILLYGGLKQKIPMLNPVLYDLELELIDRWLTLGWSPLDIFRAVFGAPWMLRLIDHLYVVWYMIKVPIFLIFLMHPCGRTRWQFFLGYNLMWIVCGACAVVIPSVGPCYYTPELFDHAHTTTAKTLQDSLWVTYKDAVLNPTFVESLYRGVAAFPSLHVGIAVYFALAMRRWPIAFWPLAIYAGLILIGSVLTGWHYACDGYFSGVVAVLIYFGTAKAMGLATSPVTTPAVSVST